MAMKYKVVLALPEARTDLSKTSQELEREMKGIGVTFSVARILEKDMQLSMGKVGLLSCVLWQIAGSVLLNDVPITRAQAERILALANKLANSHHHLALPKKGLFGTDFHIGILRSDSSVGHLLKGSFTRLRDSHSLGEILRLMKENCRGDDLYVAKF